MALSDAPKEAIFLTNLLNELGYSAEEAVTLNIDKQGAEKLASNPFFHKRTKHIDVRFHHVRELVKKKEICLQYCLTEHMVADIFNKSLAKIKHEYFTNLLKCN